MKYCENSYIYTNDKALNTRWEIYEGYHSRIVLITYHMQTKNSSLIWNGLKLWQLKIYAHHFLYLQQQLAFEYSAAGYHPVFVFQQQTL